jgi:acyloxyacyl hydrolase
MQLKNLTAKQATDLICTYTPFPLDLFCNDLLKNEISITLLDQGESADTICLTLKKCNSDNGQTCRLFPRHHNPKDTVMESMPYPEKIRRLQEKFAHVKVDKFDICTILPGVCAIENHLPYYDHDGDRFSTHNELRGGYFRGRDCDDTDATVFPGRDTTDATKDNNCNGIFGTDPATGKTYEELYCEGTGAMGVAALGDSATAHFRLPPTYFNASELSQANFAHLFRLLEDEADWPMLSWSTGHFPGDQFLPDIGGRMVSLYSKMAERNLCNHRDYQNLGVNGARVSQLDPFDFLLSRNATSGVKPLLLIFSMVGNDVCDGHHGFGDMTTPAEYFRRVERAVYRADSFLPNGSHIILVPLVDGRILYDAMHARIHPIGWTNQDVTYTDFYDYLNCLHVNPCWGWMNSNATVRNLTSEHAASLSEMLPLVVNSTAGNLTNVQVHYLGNIYMDALNKYNGPRYDLIEPVDGFHPSQLANSLIGEHLYHMVEGAGILSPPNPNNAAIKAKFGDQGGY